MPSSVLSLVGRSRTGASVHIHWPDDPRMAFVVEDAGTGGNKIEFDHALVINNAPKRARYIIQVLKACAFAVGAVRIDPHIIVSVACLIGIEIIRALISPDPRGIADCLQFLPLIVRVP